MSEAEIGNHPESTTATVITTQAERDERRAQALEMHLSGKSYRAIGAALGVSHVTAHADVQAALLEVNFDKEPERKRDVLRIERLIEGKWARATAGDDFSIDRIHKLLQAKAKLIGTESPAEVSVLGPRLVLNVDGTNITAQPTAPSAETPADPVEPIES